MTAASFLKVRVILAAALICSLAACAANLKAPPGQSIADTAYNAQIERQGLRHYCSGNRCDTPPNLISALAPIYPKQALFDHRPGKATIDFDVNADGSTGNFKVIKATSPEFSEAAVEAIKQWKFDPATFNGKPTTFRLRQTVPFKP